VAIPDGKASKATGVRKRKKFNASTLAAHRSTNLSENHFSLMSGRQRKASVKGVPAIHIVRGLTLPHCFFLRELVIRILIRDNNRLQRRILVYFGPPLNHRSG
jgi:hypothetical protein